MEMLVVTGASLLAGFVDSIVGGGGLILVPALFATFPGAPPATLLGTNKSASVWGTAAAAAQFSRRVQLRWASLLPAAAGRLRGLACSAPGPSRCFRANSCGALLPFILLARAGLHAGPQGHGRATMCRASSAAPRPLAACAIGAADRRLRRLLRARHRQLPRVPVRALAGLRLPQRLRLGQAASTSPTNLARAAAAGGQGPCVVALRAGRWRWPTWPAACSARAWR